MDDLCRTGRALGRGLAQTLREWIAGLGAIAIGIFAMLAVRT